MNCTQCGMAAPPSARFCPGCGGVLRRPCAACGTMAEPDAKHCAGCGKPLAAVPGGPQAGDALRDLRVVTILTATVGQPEDLEALEPEAARLALEAFYELVGDVVGAVGGLVDRLAGNIAVARFGAPVTRVDDPQCAASAARRIAAGAIQAGGDREFRPSVGLGTGVALAGQDVRPGGGGLYTVRGEPLEVSRLLCAAAAPGEVLADAETVQRASELFSFEPAEAFDLDGRERPAFRLASAAGQGMEALQAALGPLYGRDAERLKIEGAAAAALGGSAQLVLISGPEGLGKSRLAGEAWLQVRGRAKAQLILARAASFHGDAPYRLAAFMVESWAGLEEGDPAARLARLRDWAAALGRPDPGRSAERLAWLLGMVAPDGAKASAEQDVRAELTACVLAATRREPLVLLLEDLHRADSASLSWLRELLVAVGSEIGQLLVVLTGIEPPAVEIPGDLEVTRLLIKPLSNQAAASMLGSRLGVDGPLDRWPGPLRTVGQELVRKAGGNPFFLSELLRTLVSTGHLSRRQEEWVVQGSVGAVELPPTLKGSVASKLDRLEAQTRRLLGVAAALGGSFDVSSLQAVSQADPGPALRQLVRDGLVDPLDSAGSRYGFVQEVFRDAAYQALLPSDRSAVHGRIAAFLEETYSERLDEYAGAVADHLIRAGDRERALEFAYHAATAACHAGSNREAVRRYRQCLDLHGRARNADRTVKLPVLLQEALEVEEALGEYQEALLHARELLELAGAGHDGKLARMQTLRRIGAIQERRANFDDALEALREGLALAQGLGVPREEAALLSAMGTIELRRGKLDEVVRLGQAALGAIAPLGEDADAGGAAYAHSLLGIAYYRMAAWESSIAHHRKALVIREELRDTSGTLRSLNNLGNTYVDYGRFSQAEKLYRQALALARKSGSPQDLSMVLNNLGHLQMLRGEFAFADRHFEESAALARQSGDERSLGIALVNRGLAQTELRQFDIARESLEAGFAKLEAIGFFEQHVEVLVALGRIALEDGDAVRAWQFFHRAQFHAAEAKQPHLQALAYRATGEYHLRLGSPEAATAALTDAVKAHGDRSHPLEAARTYNVLAQALEASGRGDEAAEALAAAGRFLEGLEVPPDLAGVCSETVISE